jgi:hypothetical protein
MNVDCSRSALLGRLGHLAALMCAPLGVAIPAQGSSALSHSGQSTVEATRPNSLRSIDRDGRSAAASLFWVACSLSLSRSRVWAFSWGWETEDHPSGSVLWSSSLLDRQTLSTSPLPLRAAQPLPCVMDLSIMVEEAMWRRGQDARVSVRRKDAKPKGRWISAGRCEALMVSSSPPTTAAAPVSGVFPALPHRGSYSNPFSAQGRLLVLCLNEWGYRGPSIRIGSLVLLSP